MRNKGKVHPSPSSSSSSSSSDEALSVLKLLPAAILTLTCVLSLEDREVLAYMITRSMKATTNPPQEKTKRQVAHKPPLFHCDCFDCYTSFWFRWDSSPNRELIHQAIEAFEEHLNSGEHPKKNSSSKHRKKEKMGRRGIESPTPETPMVEESSFTRPLPEIQSSPLEKMEPPAPEPGKCEDDDVAAAPLRETTPSAGRVAAANNHKGFARKVLPDVLGVFNSRLWSLWSPNL